MNNLVSIVTPSYNSSRFICECISSVLSQTYQEWEMIIVDDCSTDDSVNLVSEFIVNESRIQLIISGKNVGAAKARNLAISKAKGKYIAFLDSDDTWEPNKLSYQINFMEENNYSFSFSAYHVVSEENQLIRTIGVPAAVNYNQMLKTCYIGCLTAIYDASVLGKVYMPLIRRRQDYGLWLKILKLTPAAYGVNRVLANYRVRSESISSNKFTTSIYTWRLYHQVEGFNYFVSSFYLLRFVFRATLRRKLPLFARALGILY